MTDYKMEAAKAALKLIEPGQTIGVGAGSTIANLIGLVTAECTFAQSLKFVSSSFITSSLIMSSGLILQAASAVQKLNIYFDGCDQFDTELNALKSGGGIHTNEKIHKLINLDLLNTMVKMIPGVVEHSLFYRMAHKAVIAGKHGTTIILPRYS